MQNFIGRKVYITPRKCTRHAQLLHLMLRSIVVVASLEFEGGYFILQYKVDIGQIEWSINK